MIRDEVSACRDCGVECGYSNIHQAPRFGLGPSRGLEGLDSKDSELFIIGPNPPEIDPLHGAWRVKYKGERSVEEECVRDLIASLGYREREVYITCAVKCPTHFDKPPCRLLTWTCAKKFLKRELEAICPRFILCLGSVADDAIGSAIMSSRFLNKTYRVIHKPGRGNASGATVKVFDNIIIAPHPNRVNPDPNGNETWEMRSGHSYPPGIAERMKRAGPVHPQIVEGICIQSWIAAITEAIEHIKENE
ncbi:MAG: hypothetical protein CL484_12215 [Acidobacteria bacterium]|nr:hypothetical protein [Acidobacteriota bacterium]|tara:strand:- start:103 stop:849 length:747 start_codon:yes stop_codon:yes gene_type:complete